MIVADNPLGPDVVPDAVASKMHHCVRNTAEE
jgi:hypothetical protein